MRSILWEKPTAEEVGEYTRGWRKLRVWLPPVIAMIVISCESTNTFSSDNTSGWLRPVFERIFGHVSDPFWHVLHVSARKTGHVSGYGMVCLSYLWAWLLTLGRRSGLRLQAWRLCASALAIASTFCVGGLDEWHQTFLPNRTGMFSDVLIDTAGGVLACLLVWLFFWNRLWGRKAGSRSSAFSEG